MGIFVVTLTIHGGVAVTVNRNPSPTIQLLLDELQLSFIGPESRDNLQVLGRDRVCVACHSLLVYVTVNELWFGSE